MKNFPPGWPAGVEATSEYRSKKSQPFIAASARSISQALSASSVADYPGGCSPQGSRDPREWPFLLGLKPTQWTELADWRQSIITALTPLGTSRFKVETCPVHGLITLPIDQKPCPIGDGITPVTSLIASRFASRLSSKTVSLPHHRPTPGPFPAPRAVSQLPH